MLGPRTASTLLSALILLGLAGACGWGYVQLHNAETEHRADEFQRLSQYRLIDMRARLQLDEEFLASLAGLFAASNAVSADEFTAFVDLERIPRGHITAVAFAPRISPDERNDFEARLREQGESRYQLGHVSEGEPAFPIEYLNSLQRIPAARGVDLASDPMRRAILNRARDVGTPIATPPHDLKDLGLNSPGVLLVIPVFNPGSVPRSTAERRRKLAGFALLVYDLSQLVEQGLVPEPLPDGVRFEILDVNTPGRSMRLHASPDVVDNALFVAVQDLRMGGRFWRVVWEGSDAFEKSSLLLSGIALLVGLGGSLLLSVLFGVTIYQVLRSRRVIARGSTDLAACHAELADCHLTLQHAQRDLDRAELAEAEFVSTLTHDLRAPLVSIQASMEQCLMMGSGPPPEKVRIDIERGLSRLSGMTRLVDDFLDCANLEAGTFQVHRRFTDVAEIMERVTRLHAPRAVERGVTLQVSAESGIVPLWVDPDRLQQVLGMLVMHALQFAPAGGLVRVDVVRESRGLCFSVEDDGPGIDEPEKVFERYYLAREGQRRCPARTGTGLSLALARRLTQVLGGEIGLEPRKGEATGARFAVRLPCPELAEILQLEGARVAAELGGSGAILTAVRARLSGEEEMGRLEDWIRAHLPPGASSRLVRADDPVPSVVVICDESSGIRERLEILSRGVFPAVVWDRVDIGCAPRAAA